MVANNNPGNLRPVGSNQGFQQFPTREAGLAAMRSDLLAKINGSSGAMAANYGEGYQPTIRSLITTYAPPNENPTENYINFVAQNSGIHPDQPLTEGDVDTIMAPMVKMESGQDMNDGWVEYTPGGDGWVEYEPGPKLTDNIGKIGAEAEPSEGLGAGFIAKDVAFSALARGAPEGLAAATPLGMAANLVALPAEAVRWAGHQAYKAITGDNIRPLHKNPIPTSHDMLEKVVEKTTGSGLYEPKTTAGKYANTVASFVTGGVANGVPLSTSVPAALASETAGQVTEGTDWEVPARIFSAVLTGYGANRLKDSINGNSGRPPSTSEGVRQVADDIKQQAHAKYAKAFENPKLAPKEVTNKFLDDMKRDLSSGDDLVDQMKINQGARDAIDDLEMFRNQPMTLKRAQAVDKSLSQMIEGRTNLGKVDEIGGRLIGVQDKFRKLIEDTYDTPELREARNAWAAQAKLRDIERILQRAETMENPQTGIKTGFRTLLTNAKKSKFYSAEELKLVKQAAETGLTGGALKLLGSRLLSGMLGITGGGASGGPWGAVAGFGVAETGAMGFRRAAEAIQKGRVGKLTDKIAKPYQQPMPPSSNAQLIQTLRNKQLPRLNEPIPR